jgi:hypothetical protein
MHWLDRTGRGVEEVLAAQYQIGIVEEEEKRYRNTVAIA